MHHVCWLHQYAFLTWQHTVGMRVWPDFHPGEVQTMWWLDIDPVTKLSCSNDVLAMRLAANTELDQPFSPACSYDEANTDSLCPCEEAFSGAFIIWTDWAGWLLYLKLCSARGACNVILLSLQDLAPVAYRTAYLNGGHDVFVFRVCTLNLNPSIVFTFNVTWPPVNCWLCQEPSSVTEAASPWPCDNPGRTFFS